MAESLPTAEAGALLRSAALAFDHGVGIAAVIAMVVMTGAAVLVNRAMRKIE